MPLDKTCPKCGSSDTEEICEYRSRFLFLCRCCANDFSVPKPQEQIEKERMEPPQERWR